MKEVTGRVRTRFPLLWNLFSLAQWLSVLQGLWREGQGAGRHMAITGIDLHWFFEAI